MVDERDTQQPQAADELSEDQLADVAGGLLGGDPDRPVIVGALPKEQQQSIQDGTSNTIMLK